MSIRFAVIGISLDRRSPWQLAHYNAMLDSMRANAEGEALAARLDMQERMIVDEWRRRVRLNVLRRAHQY